jgi:hypothetical protein
VSARDELAAIIDRYVCEAADAILAAGWIKRPTVIPSNDIDPDVVRNTCGQFIEWDEALGQWVHA